MAKLNHIAHTRYGMWIGALMTLKRTIRAVEAAQTDEERKHYREDVKLAARTIDRMQPPQPWRSWRHLGDAIADLGTSR